jgi:hypothetical protein
LIVVPTLESFEATIFITWNQLVFKGNELVGYQNLPFVKKGDYKRKMHVNWKTAVLTLLDFMNS